MHGSLVGSCAAALRRHARGHCFPLRASGRPKIVPEAVSGRPGRVPSASRRVPKTTVSAQNCPRSILHRFCTDFGFVFCDFRAIFHRFSLEPPATKAQNRNLKKESHDPYPMSWLVRCAVVSYCSHVFRNDFRTLHVQPFFVAYLQAHLVYKINYYCKLC